MSWTQAGFHVVGPKGLWGGPIGNVCAPRTPLLAHIRTIWAWPVQLAGSVLLFVASVGAHITGSALKQVMFGLLAAYGWWRRSRGLRGGDGLRVRPATGRERLALIIAMVVGTGALAAFFAATRW